MMESTENESPGEYWGNRPPKIDTAKTCRMLFQNTNGFDENANDTKTNDGLRNAKELQVSILAIAEHHLNMRNHQVANNFKNAIRKKMGPSTTYGSSCATDKEEQPRKL